MPWALAKDEAKKDRLETVLYNLIESIKQEQTSGILHAGDFREDPCSAWRRKSNRKNRRSFSQDWMSMK